MQKLQTNQITFDKINNYLIIVQKNILQFIFIYQAVVFK